MWVTGLAGCLVTRAPASSSRRRCVPGTLLSCVEAKRRRAVRSIAVHHSWLLKPHTQMNADSHKLIPANKAARFTLTTISHGRESSYCTSGRLKPSKDILDPLEVEVPPTTSRRTRHAVEPIRYNIVPVHTYLHVLWKEYDTVYGPCRNTASGYRYSTSGYR
jgi:hypothetical protein